MKPGALTHNIIKWLRNISEDSLSSDGGQLCVRFSQEEALCQRNQWARPDRVRTGTDWSDLICQASPLVITNWFSGNKTRGRVVSAVEIDHMPSPHPYFVSDHIIKSQSMRLTLSQREAAVIVPPGAGYCNLDISHFKWFTSEPHLISLPILFVRFNFPAAWQPLTECQTAESLIKTWKLVRCVGVETEDRNNIQLYLLTVTTFSQIITGGLHQLYAPPVTSSQNWVLHSLILIAWSHDIYHQE